jgi:two-component system chemotaxis response regulator CheY
MKKNILIVDDSESIRELVGTTLENAGYKVIRGINGRDGVDQLLGFDDAISLIITDLFMPIMDGIGLIKEVRSMSEYRYVPILMLTTESHLDKKIEAKNAGVTGWMVKPFEEDKLLKTVHKVIR